MLDQTQINWLFAISGGLATFVLRAMWQALRDLQKADKDLAEKVGQIEILVAGDYLKREEFKQVMDAVFRNLDKIYDKIDKKVDK